MSAINRCGLGIMLMLLIFTSMLVAEMGLLAIFVYGMITMAGFVLFVHERGKVERDAEEKEGG